MKGVDRPVLVDRMAAASRHPSYERPPLRAVGGGSVDNVLQIDEYRARAVAARLALPHTGSLLSRTRLHSAVRPVLDGGVISLVAGPGCGKTAFIMDLLATTQGRPFYLALDEADRDPKRFLKYLVATLGSGAIDECPATLDWDASEQTEGELAETIEGLVQCLTESIDGHVILAIDDLHHVDSSPRVVKAIELLVQGLQAHWTLVLSSRKPLPFGLDRLSLRGKLVELSGRQLRLTPGELAAWVQMNWDTTLTLTESRSLWRLTQGWPAALVLLGQKLVSRGEPVRHDSVVRVIRQGRDLREYVERDVVATLEEGVAEILLTASLMPRVELPRDEEVFGEDSEAVSGALDRLVSRGLLVASCGQYSYLVHPLLRTYAERELLGSDGSAARIEQVAEHLERIGEHYHAARLYLNAGRMDKASRPLRSLALSSLNAAASFAQEEWSGLMPDDRVEADEAGPWFILCKARALQERAQYEGASRLYEKATQMLSGEHDRKGLLLALLSSAFCLYVQSRWEESLAILRRADRVAETPGERAEVLVARGNVLISLCRWDEGAEDWEKAIILLPEDLRTALMYRIHLGRARLFHSLGHYRLARQWANKAAEAEAGAGRAARVMGLHVATALACLSGDYVEAQRLGAECKRRADAGGLNFMDAPILLASADVALGRWDYRTAVRLCRDAQESAAKTGDSDSAFWAEMILGDVCRCNRNPRRALEHHRKACTLATADGLAAVGEAVSRAAQGMDLVVLGQEKKARETLEEAVRDSRHQGLKTSLVPALFYMGWIYARDAQEHEAACSFGEAMRIAEEHDHVHFFNQEARVAIPIFALCDRYGTGSFLRSKVVPLLPPRAQEYFHVLAEGDIYPTDCRLGAPHRAVAEAAKVCAENAAERGDEDVVARISSLTDREREVLRAIACGLPNKVIGAQLFISEKTVKTHANHIFRKLEVNSRLQATLVFQSHQKALAAGTALRNRRI